MLSGESNSITNQKAILKKFADDNGFRNTQFYVDDGVSGTTFEREGFKAMMNDVEDGKVGIVITKDLSRLGRDYLKTGELIELTFPDYDVRYIAINDGDDTFKSENELLAFKNIFNDWYARDCSKKIKAVFKAKGQSGKHLSSPIYGYKKSETDKNLWVVDDEAAEVVKRIFRLSIDGKGSTQIARILTNDNVLVPSAYSNKKGYTKMKYPDKPTRWNGNTVVKILEKAEYAGHTVNFRTHVKSYKNRKRVENPKDEWLIFENTHEPIISQHDFDLVQELRKNRCRPQKYNEINVFSGIVYCADCGKKMHVNRGKNMAESMKCSTYSVDSSECSAHYIRTEVLNEIVLAELNKLLYTVHENENAFVQLAMDNANSAQINELKKAKKTLNTAEKRIAELDKLFIKLYEDNVSGKITDERFSMMSAIYEDEQKQLKAKVTELSAFIETTEQKSADTMQFINIVRKYEHIATLTPEIMHELIEKIVVYAPDKSSGHRIQQIDIHFRFNVATATAVADNHNYHKQKKAA